MHATDRKTFQVTQFVNGLFESRADLSVFKNHIRDFLVQSKEFSAQVTISAISCTFLSSCGMKDVNAWCKMCDTPYSSLWCLQRLPGNARAILSCKFLMDGWFSFQDNKDLYAEEAAAQRERERQRMLSIPGLIAPNELQDEMLDS